jgi:5'-nucleotidase
VARAADLRTQPLGVTLPVPITRAGPVESPLGDLAADLMRAAQPRADVAFINGGSLRADLPAGPLTYGALYEAFPFDDALALVPLDASGLSSVLAANLRSGFGILSLSGVRARAACAGSELRVRLFREDGAELAPSTPLLAVTNGYLASGGDGLLPGNARVAEGDVPVRDALAAVLRARGGEVRSTVPTPRRFEYPGSRPVKCPDGAEKR